MYAGNKRHYLIMAYLDNSWMGHKIQNKISINWQM